MMMCAPAAGTENNVRSLFRVVPSVAGEEKCAFVPRHYDRYFCKNSRSDALSMLMAMS